MMEKKSFTNGTGYCCDVFDVDLFEELEEYKLLIADPPYGGIVSDEWDKNWTSEDYIKLAELCEVFLCYGGSAYVWGGVGTKHNRQFFKFLAEVEEKTSLTLKNVITWNKKRAYGKKDDYLFTREEVAWLVKGDKPLIFNIPLLNEKRGYEGYNKKYPAKSEFKRRTNVWTDITEIFRGKTHKCEKPQRLSEIMIETHTNPGDVVLDLFAGSANVSKAAVKLGRKFVFVEGNKDTFDKIVI
jgi:DNA modification methylase